VNTQVIILYNFKIRHFTLNFKGILNSFADWKTVMGSLILSNNIRTQNIDPETGG